MAYQKMEHLQDSITTMSKTLTRLEEERDLARYRYEELIAKCQDVKQTIAILRQELDLMAPGPEGCGTPAAVDLNRCINMRERLEQIAIANAGRLNLAHARDTILASGVSRAAPSNLRDQIRKCLKQSPQEWEDVGDGFYRYRRFADQDGEGP